MPTSNVYGTPEPKKCPASLIGSKIYNFLGEEYGSGGGLDNPGGVDWLEPFVGSAGEFGRERHFAAHHGLGKGWRLASPPLPPLPGGRAGPAFGVSRCQTGEIWRIQKCQ